MFTTQNCKQYRTTHGRSRIGNGTYSSWKAMKSRCINPKCKRYARYGARGITVCERWLNSFALFLLDMGERPAGTSLERKNNDGNYEPGNCVWATDDIQALNRSTNRRLIFNGREQTISQWGRELKVRDDVITKRLRRGWSVEETLTVPVTRAQPKIRPHHQVELESFEERGLL